MTTTPHNLDRFFSGTTDEKMVTMEALYSLHGQHMLNNDTVVASLALLQSHGENLQAQMAAMDMGPQCSACAAKTGGCCSSYMEDNSDVILLLINKLSGISVVRQHTSDEDCCFLGECGCIFPIKPIFCLNYNCSHILDKASKAEMLDLETLAGTILREQTSLEATLLQIITEK